MVIRNEFAKSYKKSELFFWSLIICVFSLLCRVTKNDKLYALNTCKNKFTIKMFSKAKIDKQKSRFKTETGFPINKPLVNYKI